ncbi:MAG: hypothetical protein WBW32_15425 [Luteibacter sp.]
MAHVTGPANSVAALITALGNACADNGWSFASNVISKGDCFVQLTDMATYLNALCGLGWSGSAITTPAPRAVRCTPATTLQAFDWPVTFHVHVFDHEVYFFVRYGVDRFAYLAFGQSPVPGLSATGKGVWITGVTSLDLSDNVVFSGAPPYASLPQSGFSQRGTGPFWVAGVGNGANSYVHHNLDGTPWTSASSGSTTVADQSAKAVNRSGYLIANQPNTWNGESILAPIQVSVSRPSTKVSMLVDLEYARYFRMNNKDPEDIITLGPDRWKIYPFYRKNATNPNGGGTSSDHSGTFALAIAYDGP